MVLKFFYINNQLAQQVNLKGQIKIDQSGNKKAIFVSRQNNKYILLNIENQFLLASILERYLDVYEKSRDFREKEINV